MTISKCPVIGPGLEMDRNCIPIHYLFKYSVPANKKINFSVLLRWIIDVLIKNNRIFFISSTGYDPSSKIQLEDAYEDISN